jgi:hypothetical protein
VLGVDGICDFNAPHSGKYDDHVQFCALDIVARLEACRCDIQSRSPRYRTISICAMRRIHLGEKIGTIIKGQRRTTDGIQYRSHKERL